MLQKKPKTKANGRNKNSMPLNHTSHKEGTYGSFDSQENRQDRHRHNGHRGNHQQLFDKYMNLARDSLTAGDRVAAEFNYQHADHYLRLMNERNQERDFKSVNHKPHQKHHHRLKAEQSSNPEKENAEAVAENEPEKLTTLETLPEAPTEEPSSVVA